MQRRVDPDIGMAEAAVESGVRIGVVAALESTLLPTRELLLSVAKQKGHNVLLDEIICETAWEYKQRGDNEGYIREIVRQLEQSAHNIDVLVLAQGSMAPAADRLTNLGIPILSSPRLGIQAASALCKAA